MKECKYQVCSWDDPSARTNEQALWLYIDPDRLERHLQVFIQQLAAAGQQTECIEVHVNFRWRHILNEANLSLNECVNLVKAENKNWPSGWPSGWWCEVSDFVFLYAPFQAMLPDYVEWRGASEKMCIKTIAVNSNTLTQKPAPRMGAAMLRSSCKMLILGYP